MFIQKKTAVAVLVLVIALLLGLLLVSYLASMRQRAAFDDLAQQYSTLSQSYDERQESCTAQEQTVRDAQDRAESAERELEAMRQSGIAAAPTPKPTEQSGVSGTVQRNPENE